MSSGYGMLESGLCAYSEIELRESGTYFGAIFLAITSPYSAAGLVVGLFVDCLGAMRVCTSGCLGSGLVMVLLLRAGASALPKGTSTSIIHEVAALVLLSLFQAVTLVPSLQL